MDQPVANVHNLLAEKFFHPVCRKNTCLVIKVTDICSTKHGAFCWVISTPFRNTFPMYFTDAFTSIFLFLFLYLHGPWWYSFLSFLLWHMTRCISPCQNGSSDSCISLFACHIPSSISCNYSIWCYIVYVKKTSLALLLKFVHSYHTTSLQILQCLVLLVSVLLWININRFKDDRIGHRWHWKGKSALICVRHAAQSWTFI